MATDRYDKTPRSMRPDPTTVEGYDHAHVVDLITTHTWPKGGTISEIAQRMGVSRGVVSRLMREEPRFKALILDLREAMDDEVEGSLYQRAKGYDHTTIEQKAVKNGETYEVVDVQKTTHIPGDVPAQKHWLGVRRPGVWSAKIDVKVSGTVQLQDVLLTRMAEQLDLDPSEWRDADEDAE